MAPPPSLRWIALACGLAALALQLALGGQPDLRPVMPEVDGVHPVRALEALRSAYAPGGGFPDKYPPLGSFAMGLAARLAAPDLAREVAEGGLAGLAGRPVAERAPLLWRHRDALARALAAERWVSRLALAAAVAAIALLAGRASLALGASPPAARLGAALAALGFAATDAALHYGGTANVDALALALTLLALAAGTQDALSSAAGRRPGRGWIVAAVLLAAAAAVKDPYAVLAPVVLLGARSPRRAAATGLAGLAAYALLSGALTGPAVWREHLEYLLSGGVEGVGRIDPASFGAWRGLGAHAARLTRLSIGTGAALAGLAGLLWLGLRARPFGLPLLAAFLAPLLFFVVPVGFVYLRFLLVPIALLCVGCGVMLALLAERARRQGSVWSRPAAAQTPLAVVILVVLAALEGAGGLWRLRDAPPDARALGPALVEKHVQPGTRLAVFSEEREHGPPLDPGRWALEVRGLAEAEPALRAWQAAPAHERPAHLLWVAFHAFPPSGAEAPLAPARRPGDRLAGLYEVIEVAGAPTGEPLERAIALRPTLTLLRRL